MKDDEKQKILTQLEEEWSSYLGLYENSAAIPHDWFSLLATMKTALTELLKTTPSEKATSASTDSDTKMQAGKSTPSYNQSPSTECIIVTTFPAESWAGRVLLHGRYYQLTIHLALLDTNKGGKWPTPNEAMDVCSRLLLPAVSTNMTNRT